MTHKIFQIDTSIQPHSASYSARGGKFLADKLAKKFSGIQTIYKDLAKDPVPYLTQEWAQAALTPQEVRSQQQKDLLKQVDMSPLTDADIYIFDLAGYMYDMPATFKSWLEHSFQFDLTITSDYQPLLKNKKAAVIAAWGGSYDSVTPEIGYEFIIKSSLKMLGVTEVTFFNIYNTEDISATLDDVEADLNKFIEAIN